MKTGASDCSDAIYFRSLAIMCVLLTPIGHSEAQTIDPLPSPLRVEDVLRLARDRRAEVSAARARTRAAAPVEDRRVMLVGPGLGSGGAEVPAVAAQDPDAEVLDGESATVAAALTALDELVSAGFYE